MKLKVIKWNEDIGAHLCIDEKGNEHRVDLRVGSVKGLPTNEELIGKTVECDYIYPYISIAMNTVVVETV